MCGGKGGAPGTVPLYEPESHFTCSSPRCDIRVVPSTLLLNHLRAFFRGLGRARGPLVRYLCNTHRPLHGRHV